MATARKYAPSVAASSTKRPAIYAATRSRAGARSTSRVTPTSCWRSPTRSAPLRDLEQREAAECPTRRDHEMQAELRARALILDARAVRRDLERRRARDV